MSPRHRAALVLGLYTSVALVCFVMPLALAAQEGGRDPIDKFGSGGTMFSGVTNCISPTLCGYLGLLRLAGMVGAILLALVQWFKAAKGQHSRGWVTGLVLFVSAGVLAAPKTLFFDLLHLKPAGTAETYSALIYCAAGAPIPAGDCDKAPYNPKAPF